MPQRGYWGDIVNSPYLAFGIKSDNKELFKTVNGKHVKVKVVTCVGYVATLYTLYVQFTLEYL